MHPFWHSILDLFYPPRCQVCRRFNQEPLCAECAAELRLIQPPVCRHCGLPLDPQATGPDECSECHDTERSVMTWARSAGFYEGSLRKAILALKFHGRRSLAEPLAHVMMDATHRWLDGEVFDSVCPVPLHPSRLRERGFNQSELIARYFCDATGNTLDADLLYRTRPTLPQVALPPKERDRNVRGAFALSPDKIVKDMSVLLIDDIYTTGSTLLECAKVLRKDDAAKVCILTLARPRPPWMPELQG